MKFHNFFKAHLSKERSEKSAINFAIDRSSSFSMFMWCWQCCDVIFCAVGDDNVAHPFPTDIWYDDDHINSNFELQRETHWTFTSSVSLSCVCCVCALTVHTINERHCQNLIHFFFPSSCFRLFLCRILYRSLPNSGGGSPHPIYHSNPAAEGKKGLDDMRERQKIFSPATANNSSRKLSSFRLLTYSLWLKAHRNVRTTHTVSLAGACDE